MIHDSYKTIAKPCQGIFKDKGSKFLAFAFPVHSEEKVKEILQDLKKQYYDARHHCYAYKIGLDDDRYRVNDDGEPSGTAGKPIYGQILSNSLSDIFIVVVRYFGGTLLGTSGLINAYKMATLSSIENSKIIERIVKKKLNLQFSYELMSMVMKLVKEEGLDILEQDFTQSCRLAINVRLRDYERILNRYEKIYGVTIE